MARRLVAALVSRCSLCSAPLIASITALPLLVALAAPAQAQFTPGDIYVASWKKTIYKVDPTTWAVTTFADQADGIDGVSGLIWHPNDELLVLSYYNDTVFSFDSAGVATAKWTTLDGLNGPFGQNGLACTVGGLTYVANWDNRELLEIPLGGAATVLADAADSIAHPDGVIAGPCKNLYLANRDGKNLLQVTPAGNVSVFDTLPDQPMSVALHPDGCIYVACLYGDVYKYEDHRPGLRRKLVSFGRRLATPVIRFNRDYSKLLFTSSGKGNLALIDPTTGSVTEVLPAGSLGSPLGLEVVGGHDDIGIHDYSYDARESGTGGVFPSINASGHPVFGESMTLELRDFVGGGLVSVVTGYDENPQTQGNGTFFVSLTPGDYTVLQVTVGGAPGVAGDGDLDYTDDIGVDPALDCVEWYLQAFCDDPTPDNSGYSLSNPLRLITRSF